MRRTLLATAALLPTLALAACSSDPATTKTAAPAGSSAIAAASQDVVSGERKVDAVAALLPEDVRKAGSLRLGAAVGSPPTAFYPDPATKKAAGLDVDFADAVAKVLGITIQREDASFETTLPALRSAITESRISPPEHP
ncbi:hypothetical protein GCM10010193_21320 [Kitasatospora atroaurantiaca]|uniref:Extracellular solute-binding protein (Family 3) n=1 Tax=Kitasatospora atroaurantiaca TaxID=285545 RepID=A0A561EV40_9ACTN|nr:transporter substrate-binding domain-containing protein [Kitasatospora atroaurantiaca]TWE19476.1 extracellular solute-binding protein (family 3) [Kitasatospora atroaurantiaca]